MTTKSFVTPATGNKTYAQAPQGFSQSPLRVRPKQTNQAALRRLHDKLWRDLLLGTLQTRKAAYTTTVQFAAVGTTVTQSIPDYASLTSGLGGNTTVTADKAIVTAVTALYNLTVDPTRATNKLTNFVRDTQQVVLTTAPTAGDVIELQVTVLPYQGIWSYSPPANVASTFFEVLHWDPLLLTTSNGTGGTTKTPLNAHDPIIPKLPLPASRVNSDYLSEAVQPAPNSATAGTALRGASLGASVVENMPVLAHEAQGSEGRFREGFRFYIAGTGATRGAGQTTPLTSCYVTPLGGSGGGWPSKHVNVMHCLVRVVDALYADAAAYPLGRVFLMVATATQTSSGGKAGTYNSGATAVDLFAPSSAIDNFDGMVTL